MGNQGQTLRITDIFHRPQLVKGKTASTHIPFAPTEVPDLQGNPPSALARREEGWTDGQPGAARTPENVAPSWHSAWQVQLTFGSIAAHQRRSNHNPRSQLGRPALTCLLKSRRPPSRGTSKEARPSQPK